MSETVAFLGTGLLGKPVAHKMLEAGIPLRVWNRTTAKAAELGDSGATLCDTPRRAADGASVVFVCVRDEEAVSSVLSGPAGALESCASGAIVADLSTIGPSAAERVAASVTRKGCTYAGVPVIGSGASALLGELVVLEGAEKAVVGRIEALLDPVARRFIYCGGPAEAAKAKLAVNTLLGLLNQAIAEGYALGVALGLPSELVLEVLSETPAGRQVERKRNLIASGVFDPSFKLGLLLKDLRLALQESRRVYPAPKLEVLEAVEELVSEAVASSWRDLDYSSVAGYLTGRKPQKTA